MGLLEVDNETTTKQNKTKHLTYQNPPRCVPEKSAKRRQKKFNLHDYEGHSASPGNSKTCGTHIAKKRDSAPAFRFPLPTKVGFNETEAH